MDIVLIGAGNVSTVLGRLCFTKKHNIAQVYNRTYKNAQILAEELNAQPIDNLDKLARNADIYIVSVSDNALPEMAATLHLDNLLVVHTTGSVSINVLKDCSTNIGVIYPLQSIRKEKQDIPDLPFFVDGNTEEAKQKLYAFAGTLSPMVDWADDNKRIKLHVAAVIVSNFTNHLFAQAEMFCKEEHVPFEFLLPLIDETVSRLHQYSPAELQTGPAIRKDTVTLEKHLEILDNYPALKRLYEVLTVSIIKMYEKK